jgi:hypothetical protein
MGVELAPIAARGVTPFARTIRREANLVSPVAIVEAGDFDSAMPLQKLSGQAHIHERVAVARTFERDFVNAPPLHAIARLCQKRRSQRAQSGAASNHRITRDLL